MKRRARRGHAYGWACLVGAAVVAIAVPGRAEDALAVARHDFDVGTAASREERWSDAVVAFEHAYAAKPHPLTAFNIGVCLRATGNLLEAEQRFHVALQSESQLPTNLVQDARDYLREIPVRLATLDLEVTPADAVVSIDGRSLGSRATDAERGAGSRALLEPKAAPTSAGLAADATAIPYGKADIRLNPGVRLVLVRKPGFEPTVLSLSIGPGATVERHVNLTQQNARLHLTSFPERAVVRIDGVDVGAAPLDIERPSGAHKVVLQQDDFEPYETTLVLSPGTRSDLHAKLTRRRVSLASRWWFWTAIGVVVATATVTTYVLTRPPTPLDGGGLNWVAGR